MIQYKQLRAAMMDEEPDNLQNYYNIVIKLEHKINTYLQNIDKLSETSQILKNSYDSQAKPTVRSSQQKLDLVKQIENNGKKIQKFIRNATEQIQQISAHLNEYEQQAGDLKTKYEILSNTHRELQSSVNNLKHELQKNKRSLQAQKKMAVIVQNLYQEVSSEKQAINKLLLSQNKTTRLHNEIIQKLEELEGKQRNLIAKAEWHEKKELDADRYGRDSTRYAALLQQKTQIYQAIDQCVSNGNTKYMSKFGTLTALKSKIKDIDDIFAQLEISSGEQNFIIKQIILNEGVSGAQLLESYHQQQDGLAPNLEDDTRDIQKKLQNFRRKLEIPINSQISNENENENKRLKIKTQPITMRQAEKQKIFSDKTEIDQHMRQTRRVLQPDQNKMRAKRRSHDVVGTAIDQSEKKIKNNSSLQLPKLKSSPVIKGEQFYFPISHMSIPIIKGSPSGVKGKINERKKYNSEQITQSKLYKKPKSDGQAKKQSKFTFDSHLIRIRTKNGYIYKNPNDEDSQKDQMNGNKSQIVSLYEKLSRLGKEQFCNCNENYHDQYSENYENSARQSQKTGSLSTHIKLSMSRKKGKQSTKKMIQSRESDTQGQFQQKQLKNVVMDVRDIQSNRARDQSKEREKLSPQTQIRKRLKTIHEGEEEPKSKLQ